MTDALRTLSAARPEIARPEIAGAVAADGKRAPRRLAARLVRGALMSIGLIASRKVRTALHDHQNVSSVLAARQARTSLSNPNSTSHPSWMLDDRGPDRSAKCTAGDTNQWRSDVLAVRGTGIKLVVPGRGGGRGCIAWHADRKAEPKMISPGSPVQYGPVYENRIPASLYYMSSLSTAGSTRSAVCGATFSVRGYAYPLTGTDRPAGADLYSMLGACCASQPRRILICSISRLAASVVGHSTSPGTETETSP